mmetsp:Transcript_84938/g.150423  ORF Transcript_84938/g.150423 Transcript_84938/m.150423 type:complete len:388 (-) Transcript_84938:75-1238(-)
MILSTQSAALFMSQVFSSVGAEGHGHGKSLPPLALTQIFPFCALMYGSIAGLWMLYSFYYRAAAVKGEHGTAYIALLCITWCSFSVGMHVLNKSLAGSLEAPSLISIIQMVIAVFLLGAYNFKQFMEANRQQMRTWLVVPVFFAAMLCSSFYTYQYISLSLLTVVRNLTPLIVLPIESLVMPAEKRPSVTIAMIGAILVMLAGTMVYSGGVKDISMVGIGFAVANMILAASDRIIQRRLLTQECSSLPSSTCAIINNSVGILPCMALAFITDEVHSTTSPEHMAHWSDPRILVLLLLSGCAGIGICYMGFECQRVISATSFFVMQNVSKVAVVTCGIAFFGDPIRSPMAAGGLLLSLAGSYLYSWTQLKPKPMEKKAAEKGDQKGTV